MFDCVISKGRNDRKDYMLVNLECGLEAVVVSTKNIENQPADTKSAAAMCVQVGSFADPTEAQGLSHFLGE